MYPPPWVAWISQVASCHSTSRSSFRSYRASAVAPVIKRLREAGNYNVIALAYREARTIWVRSEISFERLTAASDADQILRRSLGEVRKQHVSLRPTLGKLLASWSAYPRGVEKGGPFIMDAKTLRGAPVVTLTSNEGEIDVMDQVSGTGRYRSVRAHSEEIEAFGVNFRVLDLPTLIKSKRAAGRPRDFEHLPELEALLALRRRR